MTSVLIKSIITGAYSLLEAEDFRVSKLKISARSSQEVLGSRSNAKLHWLCQLEDSRKVHHISISTVGYPSIHPHAISTGRF